MTENPKPMTAAWPNKNGIEVAPSSDLEQLIERLREKADYLERLPADKRLPADEPALLRSAAAALRRLGRDANPQKWREDDARQLIAALRGLEQERFQHDCSLNPQMVELKAHADRLSADLDKAKELLSDAAAHYENAHGWTETPARLFLSGSKQKEASGEQAG